ncbi:tRNA 4-thiouridine(8) synthase ThiI [Patescibacteria group bacterium]|nr:tRNA 4-thiouridine(8) synthase ThiI [Patescibacteria group bacterium]
MIIIHYSEIGLKGGNRDFFENQLVQNIKVALKGVLDGDFTCRRIFGRFLVDYKKEFSVDEINMVSDKLEKIFGIANFSFVCVIEANFDLIEKEILKSLKNREFNTFRISTRRSDKSFPMDSPEMNTKIGASVVDLYGKKVSLKNPELNCHIELVGKQAYVYYDKIKGMGGMPVGTSGKAMVLISGGFDSPVASWFALKRGIQVEFLHFHSMPYTSQASVDKVKALVKVLEKFGSSSKIYLFPFADIQKEIIMKCPEKLRVVLYRRAMMRIAESLAFKKNCKALVTGEAVGQVASQTLENMRAIGSVVNLPIIRPLVCFDKEDIIEKARFIGTYDISAKPHDDCCTRFIPKHPETKAKLSEVELAEKSIDIDEMVAGTMKDIM